MEQTPKALTKAELPPIPPKRYFSISEVSELCGVAPHVLRYWEKEFPQLKRVKRRGNRRYYQHTDVITIRHIRELLHEKRFTIDGARQQLGKGETAKEAEMPFPTSELKEELLSIAELLHP